MNRKSIILVGGPDSGKSNYVGRLWAALKAGKGQLQRAGMPQNIEYVESICENLLQGEFAGRTDTNTERQDFCVPLKLEQSNNPTELIVPDFTGELWRDAVKNSDIPREWLDTLESAEGALLFVRVLSPLNVQPLDWVATRSALSFIGEGNEEVELPTQVILCELLRLLQQRLSVRPDGKRPRVAIVVTAWDKLDAASQEAGPQAYLRKQFPLFAGALEDARRVEARVYGVSIVGGDLQYDPDFQEKYQSMIMAESGSVTLERNGAWYQDADVTIPVAWAIGAQ
ncbi:hypothetical protein BKM77_15655 [Pseudomonas syringae]|uniref:TRAFAC clade GTPase domain-containing protein n=1 Tax=Pseudomonas syringae TaxID=317 RepID=UPI000CDB44EC|nr:hypothetical protein [Pseudomonas syringae]POP83727.1 hypothetical protein CXB38_00030 [Pseudomonas syringae]RXF64012.1 hypothetical protein BKM77_15655 [Pseudomonas syringae]